MKGYVGFCEGLLRGLEAAAKPAGKMKYMDWERVKRIVSEYPDAIIYAGLREDWFGASGLIYAKGKYYNGAHPQYGIFHGASQWATPIIDVDGQEIECWTFEKTKEEAWMPKWWGNGKPVYDADYYPEEDRIVEL